MEDITTNSIIITLMGFFATFITVITPIIKLNSSITKLNTTIDNLYNEVIQNIKSIEKLRERTHE